MPNRIGRPGTPGLDPAAPQRSAEPASSTPTPAAPAAPQAWGPAPAGPTAASGMDAPAAARDPRAAGRLTGDVPPPRRLDGAAAASAPPSLAQVFESMRASGGGPARARLLSTNLDAWNTRWDLVSSAKTTIDADYFTLEKDVFGHAFLGMLLKKQLEGVKVRVMTDSASDAHGQRGFTKPTQGKDYLQELVNHGGEAYVFHPLWQRPLDVLKGNGYQAIASNHDKVLVVDGKTGITGGRNIGIEYFADPKDMPHAWRDMDIVLTGEGAAKGLTSALDAELAQKGAVDTVGKDRLGNWVKRDVELLGCAAMMDLWLNDPPLSDTAKEGLRKNPEEKRKLVEDLLQRTVARLEVDMPERIRRKPSSGELDALREHASQLVDQLEARGSNRGLGLDHGTSRDTEVKIIDQTSAAGVRTNDIAPALTQLVDAATKRIVIQNPYVVLTEEMMKGLERAAARGVEINIITNSPLSTDSAITQAFFLEDWAYILARCPTATIHVATGERKFHGKSAVIDDEKSVVSTYNLDLLSGYVNSEVGAVVKSKELAQDLLAEFERDKGTKENGFIEYTIQRHPDGRPVVKDGKPVPVFGPEDHLPPKVLEDYKKLRQTFGHTLRDNLGAFEPLRHPRLQDQ